MENDGLRNRSNKTEGEVLVAETGPESAPGDFDPGRYRGHIADCDLSEEQANELLRTLWEIMKSFVDLGFGVDSIQYIFPEVLGERSDGDANPARLNRVFEKTNNQNAGCNPGKDNSHD